VGGETGGETGGTVVWRPDWPAVATSALLLVFCAGLGASLCGLGPHPRPVDVPPRIFTMCWFAGFAFWHLTARIEADAGGVTARSWGRTHRRSWEQLRSVRRNGTLVVLNSVGAPPVRVPLGRRRRASRAAGRLDLMVRYASLRPAGPGTDGSADGDAA
jgi:hypothetical protein